MRHDPEELAARFLAGRLGRAERWRYERHLVECAECWQQVRQARAGRSAVESLRLAAPAQVRERVRATTEPALDHELGPDIEVPSTVARQRRRPGTPLLLTAAAVLVALVVGILATGEDRPSDNAMAEVSAAYRDARAWAVSESAPPLRAVAHLHWIGTRVTTIEGDRVLGDRYATSDGRSILVVRREGMFDTPADAHPVDGGDWVTEVDGVTIFCMRPPQSWLVVGDDAATVADAARTLTRLTS